MIPVIGIVILIPITSTIKPEVAMMFVLPKTSKINGSAIVEQVRTVDLKVRWWKTTGEILPRQWVDDAVSLLSSILQAE